jgi:hypothetical protein
MSGSDREVLYTRAAFVADVLKEEVLVGGTYVLTETSYLPGIQHQANEEVENLPLNELMVANMDHIRNTCVVSSQVVLDGIVMVVVCVTS